MKMLVTGANGQLGYDVINIAKNYGYIVYATDLANNLSYDQSSIIYIPLDITNKNRVESVISTHCPDVIIHCAAWTNVDSAEQEENYKKVMSVNVEGTRYLAEAASQYNSKFIYISTDYVFSGDGNEPHQEMIVHYTARNTYGKSKLEGEHIVRQYIKEHFIVRISWVFGINGANFVKTMLNLGNQYEQLTVVEDQIGNPTYTKDLAILLMEFAKSDKYGTYHVTNDGEPLSLYDLAVAIFEESNQDVDVIPIKTVDYNLQHGIITQRPLNSRLDKSNLNKNGFTVLPHWRNAIQRYLIDLSEMIGE